MRSKTNGGVFGRGDVTSLSLPSYKHPDRQTDRYTSSSAICSTHRFYLCCVLPPLITTTTQAICDMYVNTNLDVCLCVCNDGNN